MIAFASSWVLAGAAVAGCGGSSRYCDAVEKDQESLNTFGQERTSTAYAGYAKTFRAIGKLAPAEVSKDWAALADATDGVLAAQDDVGLKLDDMKDADKVADLDKAQLGTLNQAYEAFNGTTDQRTAVVKNVKQECDITLK